MLKLSEHQIQNQIEAYLRGKGYYVDRMNSGNMRFRNSRGGWDFVKLHPAGTPDLMAFKALYNNDGGRIGTNLYFIEVKAPGNKPTRLQLLKMEELEQKGARCFVAYSLEDIQKYIR